MRLRHLIIALGIAAAACGGSTDPATTTEPPPTSTIEATDPIAEARAVVVAGYAELALAGDLFITEAEAECAGGFVADALPLEELVARAEQGIDTAPDGAAAAGLTLEAFATCIDPARYLAAIIGEGDPSLVDCLSGVLGSDDRVGRDLLLTLLSGEAPSDLAAVAQEAVADCT